VGECVNGTGTRERKKDSWLRRREGKKKIQYGGKKPYKASPALGCRRVIEAAATLSRGRKHKPQSQGAHRKKSKLSRGRSKKVTGATYPKEATG